ncbi:hypothetical protein SPI_09374 [Niveomyces insectorum RCEF 264]|uniref:HNH nuclease domain-containing protein n=1 Tax=Niveomyces insectorum RCEF 264 TaxID=1081102 RepID=A0A167LSG5_9HYPO|nr:hypothetical protein SPI_09374 [Niveomyces insectorum RCEF 264]
MATSSHHRHQVSLESVFDLSSTAPTHLPAETRASARQAFYHIVDHFAGLETAQGLNTGGHQYSQAKLVRFTYEYALSELSRDIYLRAFFRVLTLSLDTDVAALRLDALAPPFAAFAEYLMDNFYLPLKASTRQTPQPSPITHSAVLRAQGGVATEGYIGTPARLASLRGTCLVRDRHRCVVTRAFSMSEFEKRYKSHGADAQDDDGTLFTQQTALRRDAVEVAHILPHSLMRASGNQELDKSREAALAVLNMFDYGVTHMIDGVDIDRTANALTLTKTLHGEFGAFNIFFDAVPGARNTYAIRSFLSPPTTADLGLPVTRTLFDSRTIDPPSPRLLAVHRAIAQILHLSAAGEYIDHVLRDMETNLVRADGSSELGRLVGLRLGGWIDGKVY